MSARVAIASLTAVLLVLLLGLLFWVQSERDTIAIGAILPITGKAAAYGAQASNALDLLVDDYNASGGLRGHKLEIAYFDDQMHEQGARAAYALLERTKRVAGIVGAMSSSAALALAPKLEDDEIVLISPTASSPDLSGINPYFFRVWPPDGQEGKAMARAAWRSLGLTRIAVLYESNDFGETISEVFRENFEDLGGTVLATESFTSDTRTFRPVLTKLAALKPEAIYVPAYYASVSELLKDAEEVAPTIQILGASPSEADQLLQLAGTAAEGFVFLRPAQPMGRDSPAAVAFRAKYSARYNNEPGPAASYTYDAASALVEAISHVGTNSAAIADYLRDSLVLSGVTGTIDFDSNGNVYRDFRLAVVRDGQFADLRLQEESGQSPAAE